jgi:ketosteroid isomerase-like protein
MTAKIRPMFKMWKIIMIVLLAAVAGHGAGDPRKLVDTENAFAKKAADTNTRQAFMDFAAPDGVIFNPTEVNAISFWEKRPVGASWLAWFPNYADVSADGTAGWDTGPWEFHPKGKSDAATAFGQFATFWVKQPNGSFKFLVDMGIGFDKTLYGETQVKYPRDAGKGSKAVPAAAKFAVTDKLFYAADMVNAYTPVLADDCIVLIDGKGVVRGRKDVLAEFAARQKEYNATGSVTVETKGSKAYGNLAYSYGEFHVNKPFPDGSGSHLDRMNYLQVWKYRQAKWQIVLEVFNDIPDR